jgi:MFS transporter, DHA1 family, tetracycline resistance protein
MAHRRSVPMTSLASEPSGRASIFPILTVNFVGALGFSIVMPSLIFLVTRFGGNALVFGLMGATYSFFQLIGAPMLGRWSDRYGRRRILLLSEVGTLVSWAIFLVAIALPTLPLAHVDSPVLGTFTVTVPLAVLFFARALDGLTGGDVSIANAYLADISPDRDRSANFGQMAVASNLGFVFGPALAGLLGTLPMGEVLSVVAALLISALACLIIAFGLPDATPCVLGADPERVNVRKLFGQEQKECFTMRAARKLSAAEILALPSMKPLLALYFLVFFAFNLFYVAFPVYAATGIRWSLLQIGVYFAAMGLTMALVQGPVLSQLTARWSDRELVFGGGVVLAASFPFFTTGSTAMIYLGTALLAAGNGVMWPSLLAILSGTTARSAQGAVQGFASGAGAVASIAGLLLGGALYHWLGSAVFLISAALIAVCVGLSLLIAPNRSRAT